MTAAQVPPWLDVDHPRIRLVDHRDLLPADALPTFNSHAIESALHRVPDLAEHFVYLNDDMLLGRPLGPERFFDTAGRFAVFTSPHPVGLDDQDDQPAYVTAALRNRRLLEEAFGVALTHHLAHAPYPQRVSVLAEVADRFADRGRRHRARAVPLRDRRVDGVVAGPALRADDRHRVRSRDRERFVDLSSTNVGLQLENVLQRRQDAVCIGDHQDYAHGDGPGGPPGRGLPRALPARSRRRGS